MLTEAAKNAIPGGLDRIKVLIVEDKQHMRALLRALLNALGVVDIYEAVHGAHALEVLRSKRCDLILTDMSMEPMDGLELTRQVRALHRKLNPTVPIIMISGHTERDRVEAARDAGVTEFLVKPITLQNLTARIAEVMERPRRFVNTPTYSGPDRRRKTRENYNGPRRRQDDMDDFVVESSIGRWNPD
ncbi:MAG TPA: response regulator [Rhizomicrobium sp.]|nr:response regulator [Rhizomicrobium sp.]